MLLYLINCFQYIGCKLSMSFLITYNACYTSTFSRWKKLLRWIIAYWSGKYWFQNYRNQNLVLRWTLCKQDIFTGSTSAMVWWAFSPSYHCFWLVECFVDAVVRRMLNQPSVEGARVVEDACSFCGWIKSQTQIKLSIYLHEF